MIIGQEEIQLMNALASVSGVNAKDCFVKDNIISFLVKGSDIGRAIGKNASNVKNLSAKLRKRVEIFEYCEKPEDFLHKALYNSQMEKTELKEVDGKKIFFATVDSENRSKILSNTSRLKRIKEIAKRNYGIDDVRIR